MINLINTPPREICHTLLFTIFYYGVAPNELTKLHTGAEFTIVYSPWPRPEWRAVQFQVIMPREKIFREIETRFLNADEVAHFECLLKGHQPAVSTLSANRSATHAL